jgi:acylpyruvate hydrolase
MDATDVAMMLRRGGARPTGATVPTMEADLAPVVVTPQKIICVGLNYARHVREVGRHMPEFPALFSKFGDSLIGPYDELAIPPDVRQMDWEAELAVVMGREARRVSESEALDYVAGYTIMNDISMRDWQNRSSQWLQGKSFERSTPLGPVLVTPDELPQACDGLTIECRVDDTLVQRDVLGDFIFDIPAVISYISCFTTLAPGDVIATGTPDGVGSGRQPQEFLREGQRVVTTIEGIGALANRVVVGDCHQGVGRG